MNLLMSVDINTILNAERVLDMYHHLRLITLSSAHTIYAGANHAGKYHGRDVILGAINNKLFVITEDAFNFDITPDPDNWSYEYNYKVGKHIHVDPSHISDLKELIREIYALCTYPVHQIRNHK